MVDSRRYKRLYVKIVSICSERDLTGYAPFLLSTLVKRSQTTLHTASNTTVPVKRFKPKTGTKPQMAARPARYVPQGPLYTSVGPGWTPSATAKSAGAVHARTSQCARPTASLPPPGGDRRLDGPSAASVGAGAGVAAPSARP